MSLALSKLAWAVAMRSSRTPRGERDSPSSVSVHTPSPSAWAASLSATPTPLLTRRMLVQPGIDLDPLGSSLRASSISPAARADTSREELAAAREEARELREHVSAQEEKMFRAASKIQQLVGELQDRDREVAALRHKLAMLELRPSREEAMASDALYAYALSTVE